MFTVYMYNLNTYNELFIREMTFTPYINLGLFYFI